MPLPITDRVCAGLLAATLALGIPAARAADFGDSQPATPSVADEMAAARQAIEQKRWAQAVAPLQRVLQQEPRNADAHNLLGYAYRWQGRMDESFAHYAKALQIDPNHRGAHEYVGMAYLKVGKPDEAERHLERLRQLCGDDCEESRDLAAALAEHRASQR